jgi:hypothetical protein
MELFSEDLRDILNSSLSRAQGHTALWCIENTTPFLSVESRKYTVVFYEDLLCGSKSAWKKVVNSLDLQRVPAGEDLQRPSQQASAEFLRGRRTQSIVEGWRGYLTVEEQHEMQLILDAFEVTYYSMSDVLPRQRI